MGFATAGCFWLPTIKALFQKGDEAAGIEVVLFDNRGIGSSSVPSRKDSYTTNIMAQDALELMDHLGWRRAHIVGHSMGGMIASRLALAAPERVASLTLISVTGGGTEVIPFNAAAALAALQLALYKRCPRKRASADLALHYSKKLLRSQDPVSGRRVKDILLDEYEAYMKEHGPHPRAGEAGHLHAVMRHHISSKERQKLAKADFPIKLIHGADDILAAPRHAARLAAHLRAPLVVLGGAHFLTRDCADQVADEILSSVAAVRSGATHADTVRTPTDPWVYLQGGCCPC